MPIPVPLSPMQARLLLQHRATLSFVAGCLLFGIGLTLVLAISSDEAPTIEAAAASMLGWAFMAFVGGLVPALLAMIVALIFWRSVLRTPALWCAGGTIIFGGAMLSATGADQWHGIGSWGAICTACTAAVFYVWMLVRPLELSEAT